MPWKEFEFRGQEVFVRVLPDGKPIVRRGLAEVRYRLGASKSYRASTEDLVDLARGLVPDETMLGSEPARTQAPSEAPSAPADANTIIIHTDGACSGNPGPAGIGVFIERPETVTEISEFIGSATNNIAELAAILRALESLSEDERQARVHLYTDSGWSLGVLVQGWKAKANLELIEKIRAAMAPFTQLELLKVRGHAGVNGNEEADRLATMAARRETSMEPRTRKRSVLHAGG